MSLDVSERRPVHFRLKVFIMHDQGLKLIVFQQIQYIEISWLAVSRYLLGTSAVRFCIRSHRLVISRLTYYWMVPKREIW